MTVEYLNAPVCRHCGSDQLATVEEAVSWRWVDFVRFTDGEGVTRWTTGDDWGDDVGDEVAETVGVACTDCYAEVRGDFGQLITTRSGFARLRERPWIVGLVAYDHSAPDPETGTPFTIRALGNVRATAKTAHLAGVIACRHWNAKHPTPAGALGLSPTVGRVKAAA